MPAARYEVGILRNRGTPQAQMLRRTWTREEILKSLAWLKRENALGAEIFIRPDELHWTLLDDVTRMQIAGLAAKGLPSSVVLETSPGNYQAWIKLSEKPVNERVLTQIARWTVKKFGGDPKSADYRHMGRLAGFTNRKPQHQRNGFCPYVLLHEHREVTAPLGEALIQEAEIALRIRPRTPTPPANEKPKDPIIPTLPIPKTAPIQSPPRKKKPPTPSLPTIDPALDPFEDYRHWTIKGLKSMSHPNQSRDSDEDRKKKSRGRGR